MTSRDTSADTGLDNMDYDPKGDFAYRSELEAEIDALKAENAALKAENERLRADAERYRFLKRENALLAARLLRDSRR